MSKRIVFLPLLALITLACLISSPEIQGIEPGSVLFKDEFDNPRSGWDRRNEEWFITDYENGIYRIKVGKNNLDVWSNPGLTFSDVIIEVDATKAGGHDDNNFGVICRYDENGQRFYFFVITSDGFYAIGKVVEDQQILLGAEVMQPSEAIRQGYAINRIRAECVSDQLLLFVNDQKVAEFTDGDFDRGDVGLIAGSFGHSGIDIYFDNFVVKKP